MKGDDHVPADDFVVRVSLQPLDHNGPPNGWQCEGGT